MASTNSTDIELRHGFRLGRWAIEPSEGTATDGETTQRFDPKVMAVLMFLAKAPGRVVSHDEIIQEVWNGEAVSNDALRRCIYSLRKLLGDDSNRPSFIETLPRRGYRLLVEPRATSRARAKHSGRLFAKTRSKDILPYGPVATEKPRYLLRLIALSTMVLVAVLATAFAVYEGRKVDRGSSAGSGPYRVEFGAIANRTNHPVLDYGFATELAIALDDTAHFVIAFDEWQWDQDLGATPIRMTGQVTGKDHDLALELELMDLVNGKVVAQLSEPFLGLADAIPAAHRMARRVGEALGSPRADGADQQVLPAPLLTDSFAALNAYERARMARRSGDDIKAFALVEEAVVLDPGFQRALISLLVWRFEAGHYDQASTALEVALESLPSIGPEELVLRAFDATLNGRADAVYLWELAARLLPSQPAAGVNAARARLLLNNDAPGALTALNRNNRLKAANDFQLVLSAAYISENRFAEAVQVLGEVSRSTMKEAPFLELLGSFAAEPEQGVPSPELEDSYYAHRQLVLQHLMNTPTENWLEVGPANPHLTVPERFAHLSAELAVARQEGPGKLRLVLLAQADTALENLSLLKGHRVFPAVSYLTAYLSMASRIGELELAERFFVHLERLVSSESTTILRALRLTAEGNLRMADPETYRDAQDLLDAAVVLAEPFQARESLAYLAELRGATAERDRHLTWMSRNLGKAIVQGELSWFTGLELRLLDWNQATRSLQAEGPRGAES